MKKILKRVFIGSSQEGFEQAVRVAAILSEVDGTEPLLWTDAFANGDITFLRIEELSSVIAGAVLLATPDDRSVIRGQQVSTPRANVLFEYGFLTAALGRRRVALCRYEDVELPSDFQGLTHIPMGKFEPLKEIDHHAKKNLKTWAEEVIPVTYEGIPASIRSHGYSGIWRSTIIFSLWRGLDVRDGESVEFRGYMLLHIPPNGCEGVGAVFGELSVNIRGCYAEFKLSDSIREASVGRDGQLHLRSEAETRQRIAIQGEPPQQDGFEQAFRATREFRSILRPSGLSSELHGDYISHRGENLVSKGLEIDRRISHW